MKSFLEEKTNALVALEESSVSPIIFLNASIWQYLVLSYLSNADKANLRLVCQFFLRHVLSSPLIWKQWVDVSHITVFQQQSKKFGWVAPRPIYGVFYPPDASLSDSLPLDLNALDFSQFELFFYGNNKDLMTTFAMLPKQLRYLKLQYSANITESAIRILMQNNSDLYIDFAGNNLLFWACYWGWKDIVTSLLEQITSQQGPFSKVDINQGNGAVTPLMIAKQQGHVEIVKLLAQHVTDLKNQDNNEIELQVLCNNATHLQSLTQFTENNSLPTSQQIVIATKQWVYEMSEKIAPDYSRARSMAYQITLWLEYLAFNPFVFSQAFGTRYTQLFALLLIDIYLESSLSSPDLRKKCPTKNLIKLALDGFPQQEIDLLKNELYALQLPNIITIKPILKVLEKIMQQIPQVEPIINVTLSILDLFNSQFYSMIARKEKLCAAAIAIARLWVLEKSEEVWPQEYIDKTKMTLNSFKYEYDQMYLVAVMCNDYNLAKKKLEGSTQINYQPGTLSKEGLLPLLGINNMRLCVSKKDDSIRPNFFNNLPELREKLTLLPQTAQIQNIIMVLLDAYNLLLNNQDKEKVAAALIAVSRNLALEKAEEAWPEEYVEKTKMTLDSFKEEYDLINRIASYIKNIKNNTKQKEESKNLSPVQQKIIAPTKLSGSFFASSEGNVDISSPRKGLTDQDKRLKVLPQNNALNFASAIDNADSFYDAIVQALSLGVNTNPPTIKSLRALCSNYLQELEKSSPQANWAKTAIEKENEKDTYQDYLDYIQYTQEQIEILQKEGKTTKSIAISGKMPIEGRILASILNIKLHVIVFREAQAPTNVLITPEGVRQQEATEIDYQDKQIIHLAVHNHFVPILSSQVQSNEDQAQMERCLQALEQENSFLDLENSTTNGVSLQ